MTANKAPYIEPSAGQQSHTHPLSLIPHYFSPFDRIVLLVLLALVGAIVLTIALGDRVGVTLVRVAPLGASRSTSPILIQFSEAMNRDSVAERLRLDPDLKGEASWSGATMLFRPDRALKPGQTYTVILEPGARSEDGREVLSEYQFSFTVRKPRVAYLFPADSVPQNIWVADPDDLDHPQQVTFSPSGIYDFAVSPDGSQIAFSERNSNTGTSDIKLLDLDTGALQQLTNCLDSDCTTPVWRPDGRVIAYNRVDYNSDLGNVGSSPTRVWLIDLSTTPASTRPLLSDLQILGYSPQWSADGSRIAFFNRDEGILVYDFNTGAMLAIPSRSGSAGALSPDGAQLVFPELVITEGEGARSYLKIADLQNAELSPLTDLEQPVQDERAVWRPDGQQLAIARRYNDERYTRGYQIYLVDPDDGSAEPLTDDPRYSNAFFTWDPNGDQLVIQRFPELDENGQPNMNGRPEIWTVDVNAGELVKIVVNAFHPRWVP